LKAQLLLDVFRAFLLDDGDQMDVKICRNQVDGDEKMVSMNVDLLLILDDDVLLSNG